MSEFQTLLDDLDALHKAMPKGKPEQDDDDEIKNAAGGDADDDGIKDGDEDINDENDDENDENDEPEPMGKSFAVTLADGTEVEAMDGTELIKALSNDITTQRAQTEQILSGTVDLIKSLSIHVADLSAKVERLSKASGRRSVLNVHEKPDILGKSLAPAVSPQSVLAKALKAQREGRLGGHQVAEIETYLNRGAEIPHALAAQLAD